MEGKPYSPAGAAGEVETPQQLLVKLPPMLRRRRARVSKRMGKMIPHPKPAESVEGKVRPSGRLDSTGFSGNF